MKLYRKTNTYKGKLSKLYAGQGSNIYIYIYVYILAMACRLTATELSDPVVSSSCAMLTGSMFCLCVFSFIFSIDGRM